ncbi:hypothetical protein L1N85_15185 [Paenibacillus alkaliterrae]|uniref:glycosyltransferase n=1 Tax=Paenibacillus alkaliterrae TaxID=320909 RepID=UPI001F2AD438|nr:glycosyltransferase [Paenibacillus alkaliterrae]MCF2939763.1 hypothetical protein [Paenibacillus alkaliterrae]
MKILLISGSFPQMKCGVGDYTFLLAKELSDRNNIELAVLTSSNVDMNDYRDDRFRVHPIIKRWDIRNFIEIIKFIRYYNPDIVHVQYPTMGYKKSIFPNLIPLVMKILKVTTVQTWHEPLSWKGNFRYIPNLISENNIIFVESNYLSMISHVYRRFLKNKNYIHIPISSNIPKSVLSDEEKVSLRNKFDKNDKRIIGYFGFVTENKGIEYIFTFSNPKTDVIILICDLDANNLYHNKILNLVENYRKNNGEIYITGHLSKYDVSNLLSIVDVIALPFVNGVSERNGSFLAARAQGTLILTTHKALRGYDKENNVYYVQCNDIEMMRNVFEFIKKNDSKEKFEYEISWSKVASQHLDYYKEISL